MSDALVRALESFFIQRYRILPYLASFRGLRMRPTARYEAKSENSSLSPHLSAPPALHMLPHICEDVFHWLIVVSLPTSLYLLPLYLHFSSSWRFMRHVGVLRGKRHPELNARLSVRRKFCLRVACCWEIELAAEPGSFCFAPIVCATFSQYCGTSYAPLARSIHSTSRTGRN